MSEISSENFKEPLKKNKIEKKETKTEKSLKKAKEIKETTDSILSEEKKLFEDIIKNKEIAELIKSGDYHWDASNKTLSFSYNIDLGKKRDAEIYISQKDNKVIVSIDVYNTWGRNGNEEDKVLTFSQSQIDNIPGTIRDTFQKGVSFETLTNNETLLVDKENLLKNISSKAEKGVKLFDFFSKNLQ